MPGACRWLLTTQLLFLRKDAKSKNKDFDDEQWTLEEHPWDADIPEAATMTQEEADAVMNGVDERRPEQGAGDGDGNAQMPPEQGEAADASAPKAKVRPIHMGEFLCKWACRRLLQVAKPDICGITVGNAPAGCRRPGRGGGLGPFSPAALRRLDRGSIA